MLVRLPPGQQFRRLDQALRCNAVDIPRAVAVGITFNAGRLPCRPWLSNLSRENVVERRAAEARTYRVYSVTPVV